MQLEEALSKIPRGMIWRLESNRGGKFYCLVGWPTTKGNYSQSLGKYPALGDTPADAVLAAIARVKNKGAGSASYGLPADSDPGRGEKTQPIQSA